MMFLDSGMRVSELANLNLDDVDMSSGSILIRHGKGGKERVVRIGATAQKALWRYVTIFRRGNTDRLFLNRSGSPLDTTGIKLMIRRLGKKAGVLGVHVYRLRHTFAISYLRNGGDIFSLKYLLGHPSLNMVQRYLGSLSADDAAQAHRRFSPVDNMKIK
jgi:integrase/recombinase XerD